MELVLVICYPQSEEAHVKIVYFLFLGLLALEKLGICVETYYACEIDDAALNVVRKNFGERVINLGDVRQLTEDKLSAMPTIDLLIAGSPCNDLSLANPRRKGLYGK